MIVGREAELARVEAFLAAIDSGPAALVVEGEAGVGKTTVWSAGVAAARERGDRVLAGRPAEAEAQLAYAALGDVLAEIGDDALEALPAPQRDALAAALLRAAPARGEPLQRAVALGALGVLRGLGGRVVVAIDDAQWLDPPSATVLAFALRRLGDARVGVLVAQRPGAALDLEQAERVVLGGLDRAALDRLLRERLDAPLRGRTLARVHAISAGNPLFAVQIARAVLARGGGPEPADLPIPADLQALVGERLAGLPAAALAAARAASALARPTVALLEAAVGGGSVAAAAAAGVVEVEVDGERVRFAHPLLASVTYARIPDAERRRLHARLGALLADPQERARHLALAATGPDAAVAAALDEAARGARARGAPDTAAELLERARALTPRERSDEARRRGIEAAERHFEAGETEHAQALLEAVAAESPPGAVRAHALARLGWVRTQREGFRAAAEVFRQALEEGCDDAALRIEIEEGLAWCEHSIDGVAAAEPHARTALALAEGLGDARLLAGALSHVAFLESLGGCGVALERIERALALQSTASWSQILGRPDWIHGLLLLWSRPPAQARDRFDALHREALERGEEHSLPFILFPLARAELLLGDWEAAARHAEACHETAMQSGQVGEGPYAAAIRALVAAHVGRVAPARALIAEGLELAERLGVQPARIELLAARGFLELSLGRAPEADAALEEVGRLTRATGLVEPALFRFHGDAVEVKVALGRLEEARAALAALDELVAALGRPGLAAIAGRSRALIRAATGEPAAAAAALSDALALHAEAGEPFERARTLLALGAVARRDRQKRAARDALREALAAFDTLGAGVWSDRARAELARVGGRPAPEGLTPTEARIAELIAAGRTYREAADALFISPKTVQWNLSKVYRKLGIRSRAELPGRLGGREDRPVPR